MKNKTEEKERKKITDIFIKTAKELEANYLNNEFVNRQIRIEVLENGSIKISCDTPIPLSILKNKEEYFLIKCENGFTEVLNGRKGNSMPIPLVKSSQATVLYQQDINNIHEDYDNEEDFNFNPIGSC